MGVSYSWKCRYSGISCCQTRRKYDRSLCYLEVCCSRKQSIAYKQKRYEGVGGHLFAIAAHRSMAYGFDCAISGFAADRELMEHYCRAFGAEPICMLHPYQIFIPEISGAQIKEVYDFDWTDETL